MVSWDQLVETARRIKVLAERRKSTAATAESCTGGLVGAAITAVPGSSSWYLGGVVSYSNDVKGQVLGVMTQVLEQHGAVSQQCALQMASGVARLTGAQLAVSITGIAGPDGGTEEKPVGTAWFGLATPEGVTAWRRLFQGNREEIRLQAAQEALSVMEQWLNAERKER